MGGMFTKLFDAFKTKKLDLCLVGLENAGKTTLLSVISLGEPVETLPTVGLNVKQVKKNNVKMKVWDLGGQARYRSEWSKYTAFSDVIVFVVDGADKERIPVAKKELHKLLDDKAIAGVPLLVCLNKIDIETCYTKTEIVKHLNLDYIQDRPWIVVPISALKKTNIEEFITWLVKNAKN